MVYLRDRYAGFLPLSSFGDGIRRVLSLALAVPRAKRGILLVDEIETGLHVSMLSTVYGWLWRACFQHDVQLFATTHSLEALDAMLDADTTDDEDTVAFQFLGDSDHPSVRRFGEHQLKRLRRERGLDIR
jgi:AAA15 family ATPase/GTPase